MDAGNRTEIHRNTLMHKSAIGFDDDTRLAYRICVVFPDQTAVIPIKFARRIDAVHGLKSLKKIMSFDGSYKEVRDRLIEIGPDEIRKTVCQAMQW